MIKLPTGLVYKDSVQFYSYTFPPEVFYAILTLPVGAVFYSTHRRVERLAKSFKIGDVSYPLEDVHNIIKAHKASKILA